MEPAISLRGVTAELGDRPVLHGIDLTVGSGEVVALLGANGSGKSTVVRATVGQVPVAAGELALFGTPVSRFRNWRRVGYVPQRSTAASGVPATVREVVNAGRLAHRGLRPLGRADRQAVDRALDLVRLADRARDPVESLSGGQHQRALIARALAGEPDLLIMDEPLAGVDLDSQRVLARTLSAQIARGVTVLLVLHELGPLRPLINRAVVLSQGRVERTVTSPELLPDTHACHPEDAPEPSEEPQLQTGIL
ncbi:metal ABC transporter ATP-binding protein [Streptomyces sodiiphilus]|uniref:Metal ABC transporter ATP-binding protein n=1 Tax=Streptomyces sodiiphilus TaxID=226217 RepID=A0ABN2PNQ2_9ACTN